MSLVYIIAILAIVILFTPLLEKFLGNKAGYLVGATFLVSLAILFNEAPKVINETEFVEFSKSWISELGVYFDLKLDGLGLVFGTLVLGIGALVMFYSAKYLPKKGNASFYALMTAFAVAMLGLVFANDIVLLLIFWEFTTICSFFLISRSGITGYQPSLRTLLLTATGGLSLLCATASMVVMTGTSRISEILIHPIWQDNRGFTTTIAVLLMVAAFTKSAQFPFHAWLPDAMAAIMPVSAYLHAAAMVKAGIFLLMRFSPALSETPVWNIVMISAGLTTMIIGAVFALQRNDIKELLAYSTVSQLGLLVATIGIGTKYALTAAALHVIAHALFKSSLFMSAGVIDKQSGTRDLREIAGLGRSKPLTGITVALGALSMAGIVPLLGFISKEFILESAFESSWSSSISILIALGLSIGSILTFAYSGKIVLSIYAKNPDFKAKAGYDSLITSPFIVGVLGLLFGLVVWTLDPILRVTTLASLNVDYDVHLALWHGLKPALYATLVIYVLGALMLKFAPQINRAIDRKLFPSSGVEVLEHIRSSMLKLGVRTRNITSIDSPPRHLAVPIIVLITYSIYVYFSRPNIAPLIANSDRASDWFLLALLIVPVVGLLRAKSRISAVVLLGGIGLIMMLYFFTLGAPDVGLTQLLVELLTVIFMMFSLRRLPKTFHRTTKQRKILAGSVAVVVGSLVAAMTYFLTGRREFSATGEYYLENAKAETGGTNVVNTILVDFRALDTLVELTVLATAGIAIMALLIAARVLQTQRRDHVPHVKTAADSFSDNHIPIRLFSRALIPLALLLSAYLMLRGHYEPGGGFIGALFTCVAIALVYLGTSHRNFISAKWLPYLFIGNGLVISVTSGLLGYFDGAFLRPLKVEIDFLFIQYNLTTALLFDIGVFLAVVGVVLASINRLSMDAPHDVLTKVPNRSEVEDIPGPLEPSEVTP